VVLGHPLKQRFFVVQGGDCAPALAPALAERPAVGADCRVCPGGGDSGGDRNQRTRGLWWRPGAVETRRTGEPARDGERAVV
jgi:hypothetical protein